MKTHIALFSLLTVVCLMMTAAPAMAGVVYDNGPINGVVNSWVINFGFFVSDSVTVSGGDSSIHGLAFGAWLIPGDTLTSAEVSSTSQPGGGAIYFDQVVNFTQSGCAVNQYAFDICTETGGSQGPDLANGTYWLTPQNAVVDTGDPIYWDENSGVGCTSPGCLFQAEGSGVGSIPSESSTLYGSPTTIPEPSSIVLFGSAIFGLAGFLRRKGNV